MCDKLVTELMELATKHKEVFTEKDSGYAAAMEEVCGVLSKNHNEDIAVLASKKRMYICFIGISGGKWSVGVCPTNGVIHEYFSDSTYASAVEKARAFLSSLPNYNTEAK